MKTIKSCLLGVFTAVSLGAFADEPCYVDVLFALDAKACSYLQDERGLAVGDYVSNQLAGMNAVLTNSGLHTCFQFRSVGVYELGFEAVQVDSSKTLTRDVLENATGGKGMWEDLHTERDNRGADVVSVIIDTGSEYGHVGDGNALQNLSKAAEFSENAYSVVGVRSTFNYYAVLHEIGHNLGAGHALETSTSDQSAAYSHGYNFTVGGQGYYTVMGYPNNSAVPPTQAIPYFSTPDKTYLGVAVGTADRQDNVRVLKQTYLAASQWRSLSARAHPLMSVAWNQSSPMNDFAAVAYKNGTWAKAPCGCPATAAAQMLKHYAWPVRTDEVFEGATQRYRDDTPEAFPIRFDGHNDFLWAKMQDRASDNDVIGNYETARLTMWCGAMALTDYRVGDSSADFENIAESASPWFKKGRSTFYKTDGAEATFNALTNALDRGEMVQVMLKGHQVVADAYRFNEGNLEVHLNYGHAGSDTKWYTKAQLEDEYAGIINVWTGFTPKKMAQLKPLPKQVNGSVPFQWNVPAQYADEMNGFTIMGYYPADVTMESYAYPFGPGTMAADRAGTYYLKCAYGMTATSKVSYTLNSYHTSSIKVELQARFDADEWVTIATPEISTKEDVYDKGTLVSSGWLSASEDVNLGSHAGKTAEFRFKVSRTGKTRTKDGQLYFAAPTWSNIRPSQVLTMGLGAQSKNWRSYTYNASGIAGKVVSFTIEPTITDSVVSEPVATKVVATAVPAQPSIVSIDSLSSEMTDGFRRTCGIGKSVFFVKGNETTTNVTASSSHLALVDDDAIAVKQLDETTWAVAIDATDTPANSQLILTLCAEDALGNKAYKDLQLAFKSGDGGAEPEDTLAKKIADGNFLYLSQGESRVLQLTETRNLIGRGTVSFSGGVPGSFCGLNDWGAWRGRADFAIESPTDEQRDFLAYLASENTKASFYLNGTKVGGEEPEAGAPILVWQSGFDSKKDGWTIGVNGNALTESCDAITLNAATDGTSKGIKLQKDGLSLTNATVLVRYSGYTATARRRTLVAFNTASQVERWGLGLNAENKLNLFRGTDYNYYTGDAQMMAESGTFGVTIVNNGDKCAYVPLVGGGTGVCSKSFEKVADAITGFSIGGIIGVGASGYITEYDNLSATVSGIAVFDRVLTQTEIENYLWPEEPSVPVSGTACLYDWTFTNKTETTGSKNIAAAVGSQHTTAMNGDSNAHYANNVDGLYTALKAYVRPYANIAISGGQSVAYYGTVSEQANTLVFTIGDGTGNFFVATGAENGEMVLGRMASLSATIADATLITAKGVKSPSSAPHLYAVYVSSDRKTVRFSVDGELVGSKTYDAAQTINAGLQISGVYRGKPTHWLREETSAATSAANCLRVYDHELTGIECATLIAEFKSLWTINYDLTPDRTLVLSNAFASALNVANGVVKGPVASTLVFDLGAGVEQEIMGTTSDSGRWFTLKSLSGVLKFTTGGGSTSFRGRTVVADGSNAVIRLATGDATGYNNPGVLIRLANGGTLEVGKRDTLCTPVEQDDGVVMLLAGCADGNRGLDLFNGSGNNWTVAGESRLAVEVGASANDRKVHLRNGNWNINVAEDGIFTVDATVVSDAGGDGTRGNIVKTGAGILRLTAANTFATELRVEEGMLELLQPTLGGSLVMDAGTTIDIAHEGKIADGTVLLTAGSIDIGNATLLVNGESAPEVHVVGGKLKVGKPPVTTCLNPYAMREGEALKVSCNAAAAAGEAAKAYDGNLATYFAPGAVANSNGVSWAGIEFTNGIIVTEIAFSGNYARRMIGGAFQGANVNDFSDAENIYVVDSYSGGTVSVELPEAKGPYKYLRFIGMYGGNVSEIKYYGLADSGAFAPTNAPSVAGWSDNGVANVRVTADKTIPQVFIVQRAMRNFCDPDGSDYETCVTLAPQLGETMTWTDRKPTGYAMYRMRGFNANGASDWTYFEIEPEKLIAGPVAPTFKGNGPGFYASEASVEIVYGVPDAQIYYTTDGSTPTTNSMLYTGAIVLGDVCGQANPLSQIRTNPPEMNSSHDADYGWHAPNGDQPNVNVIRARAFLSDGSASTNEIAGTWMIGPTVGEHLTNGLRVVSVITDKENYFGDPKGIMVPGDIYNEKGWVSGQVGQPNANYFQSGDDWERPAFVEMFDEKGVEMFSNKMGTRVHGNWSRATAKKTLVCYSRKELGSKNIKLDKKKFRMFNDEPDHNKYKRIMLRNGGNDWYKACLRDAVGQSLFRGYVNTGTQGYEPTVMYVNGEYWGVHNLRHAYSKQHFEEWNGAVEDDIDYVKLDPDSGDHFEVQEGDFTAMWNIMQYMIRATGDGKMDDDEYAVVSNQVDIADMIDYHIMNIFLGNNDWLSNGNNMGYWRNRSGDDRRWHFTVYDCDSAMSFNGDSYKADHIAAALSDDVNDTNDGKTKMAPGFFKRCFKNAGFKRRFANRFADLLNTALKAERTTNIVAQAAARVEPEVARTVARWTNMGSVKDWNSNIQSVRTFFVNRPAHAFNQVATHCSGGDLAEIAVTTSGLGKVKVNTVESGKEFQLPFRGQYFSGIPITLTATPESGSVFAGWKIGGEIVSTEAELTLAPTNGVMFTACFEAAAGNPQQALRIVEIYGSTNKEIDSEKNTDEYVVITNTSDQAVSLAGLKLTSAKVGKTPSLSIALTTGTVEANGIHKLKQADWTASGWEKITNGAIVMTLTDSDGVEIQVCNTEFAGDADGGGASMLADNLDNPCNDWSIGPIHDVPPTPPPGPEPGGEIISGDFPDGTNITLTAAGTVKIGNATFGKAIAISGADATIELQAGTTATAPAITASGALTIDGAGTLVMSNSTTLISCGDLVITNGTLNLAFSGTKAKAKAVELTGNFTQYGGAVSLVLDSDVQVFGVYCNTADKKAKIRGGTFDATIDGGEKSAAIKMNKGSGDVKLDGGTITVNLAGTAPRFVNTDGKLDLDGAEIEIKTVGAAENARVFSSVKAMTISGGVIKGKATGAGSEIFSTDNKIKVTGGVVSVTAADDCFSAETNVTISAGKVQALSTGGDAIDSNGDVEISGGYVFATTCFADGYGIEADGEFRLAGGSVVAVGGPNMIHAPDEGSVACYTNACIASLKKYLVLTSDYLDRTEKLSVNLESGEKRHADGFSLVAVVPNMYGTYSDTETKPSKDKPKGEKLDEDIDGVFVTTVEKAEPSIVPGIETVSYDNEEDATNAAAQVAVSRPAEVVADNKISEADYAALFNVKAVQTATSTWELVPELKPAVSNAVQVAVDAAMSNATLMATLATDAPTTKVTTQAGLFYGMAAAGAVGEVGEVLIPFERWVLGTGTDQELEADKPGEAAGFYQIRVQIEPPK